MVAALAFALNYLALADRDASVMVAVADAPLSAGSVLDAGEISTVPVPTDFAGLDSLVTEAELADLEGWIVERPLPAGGLVTEAILVPPAVPTGLRAMSLPVEPEHAVGGSITAGDKVDIIAITDGEARYVVSDVLVLAVAEPQTGLGGIGAHHVVVAVDAGQALSLAEALGEGSIEVIKSTGAPPVEEDG